MELQDRVRTFAGMIVARGLWGPGSVRVEGARVSLPLREQESIFGTLLLSTDQYRAVCCWQPRVMARWGLKRTEQGTYTWTLSFAPEEQPPFVRCESGKKVIHLCEMRLHPTVAMANIQRLMARAFDESSPQWWAMISPGEEELA